MEGYIAFLNTELAIVADRKKKIEVEIVGLKEAQIKRYATL